MSDKENNKLAWDIKSLYTDVRTPPFQRVWEQAEVAQSERRRPIPSVALATVLSILTLVMVATFVNQDNDYTELQNTTITDNAPPPESEFNSDFLLTQTQGSPIYYTDFLLEISDNSTWTSVPEMESSIFNYL